MSEYNIKECRKIIQQYREERLKSKDSYILNLRLKALNRLNKNVRALAEDGFDIRIVLGITRKKTEIISHIVCDSEAEILALDSCPRYDGEKYVSGVPEEYFVPEEEIVHWTTLSTLRILNKEENLRFNEVMSVIDPEETRNIAGEERERI